MSKKYYPLKKKYYLAYGSNLNVQQMAFRCPSARVVGTAFIEGYRLMFKGSRTGSYLTIEPCEGSRVPVGVWEVSTLDERSLDRYEGYPIFYYKKPMQVELEDWDLGEIRTVDAFVYIMHEDHPFGIPSDAYIRTCEMGYSNFRFNEGPLLEAFCYSQDMMKGGASA